MPFPVKSDEQNSNSIAGLKKYQAQAFFEYYKKNLSGQNVALAYDPIDKEYTEIATELQMQFAANHMINRLTVYSLTDFGRDYKQMAKEMLLNNRVIYAVLNNSDVLQLKNAVFDNGANIKLFVNRYMNTGKNKNGEYYIGLKSFKDSPYFTEILVNLRLQGKEPIGLGMYGFASLKFWTDVIAKANSFDYDVLKIVMNNNFFTMPWGEVKGGKSKLPLLYGVFERKGEEYTQVN